MSFTHSHVSFQQWKRRTWECFLSIEQSYPLKKNFSYPKEKSNFEALMGIIYPIGNFVQLSNDDLNHFAFFAFFLWKSTVLFDFSFVLSAKEKNGKLSLMLADLYLVQSGESFSKINHFGQCTKLLQETLSKISASHLQYNLVSTINMQIKKHIFYRFGSIIYCVTKAPFLLAKNKMFNDGVLLKFSKHYALWAVLAFHPLIKLSSKNRMDCLANQYHRQFLEFCHRHGAKWDYFNQFIKNEELR